MNNTINPLQRPVEELSKQLNLLNGLIGHLNAQLGNVRQSITQRFDRDNIDTSLLFSGSRLAITDLEGSEWQHFFFGPKRFMFKAQGEEYFQMVDALIQRESAWTVSQGYESFKTFLYRIAATYLANHHETVDPLKLKGLNKFNEKKAENAQPDKTSYWYDYAMYLREPVKVLSLLRRIDIKNRLKNVESYNHREVNLTEWFSVVSLVRHATVHNNSVIPIAKMNDWTPKKRDILSHFFPGTYGENGYVLQLTTEHAKEALQMFAEYAYVIFGSLSRMHGYKWSMIDERNRNAS